MNNKIIRSAPVMLCHPGDVAGRGHYRIIQPVMAMGTRGLIRPYLEFRMLDEQSINLLDPDVVVWNGHEREPHHLAMQRYKKQLPGIRFVFDIDDLMLDVPDGNIHKKDVPANIRETLKYSFAHCETITVPTQPLAEIYRKKYRHSDIRVIPNKIPKEVFDCIKRAQGTDRPFRVGWAGGISHGGDLRILSEIVKRTKGEVQWVFFGLLPEGITAEECEYHPPVPFGEYMAKLASLDLDLAVAPLEDHVFNTCKSNLRLLEYGTCGYPVLATDIDPYRGSPARLLKNDAGAWVQAILEQKHEHALVGSQMRDWVCKNFILEDTLEAQADAWLSKASTRRYGSAAPFVTQVRPCVVVGKSTLSMPHYDSFSEVPEGADVLYVRPGTFVMEQDVTQMRKHLADGTASVSVWSNGGGFVSYPKLNAYVNMDQQDAFRVREEVERLFPGETARLPFCNGACVLLGAGALAAIGLPREEYESPESQLSDWSIFAAELGFQNKALLDVFTPTVSPEKKSDVDLQRLLTRFGAYLRRHTQESSTDPVKVQRSKLETGIYGRYPVLPELASNTYDSWAAVHDTITLADKEAMVADIFSWKKCPLVGVVIPVYNVEIRYLKECLDSVKNQVYKGFKICVADDGANEEVRNFLDDYQLHNPDMVMVRHGRNQGIAAATNSALELTKGCDWVTFLDDDDTLAPHALYMALKEVAEHPECRMVFSDQDKLNEQGERCDPLLKPGFDYEFLLFCNYVTHFSMYQRDIIEAIGGMRTGFDGAQDYDFVLRYLEHCGRSAVRHIPRVLYHWRAHPGSTALTFAAKPKAAAHARKAILEHLIRTKQQAMVSPHPISAEYHQIQRGIPGEGPHVSIIIPTKHHPELVEACTRSITTRTIYQNYEILIMDNGDGTDPSNKALKKLEAKIPKLRVIGCPGPFNYSAINNEAVRQAKGELILLLNDDTEVVDGAWLSEMVSHAIRPEIGCVGAKLLYPDRRIQHAGIIRMGGQCLHLGNLQTHNSLGYSGILQATHESSSVTGACLMVRRSVWDELNGMDESFPVYFNDVDFGERAREKGYINVVPGTFVVIHKESQSLGKYDPAIRQKELDGAGKKLLERPPVADPYWNVNAQFGLSGTYMGTPKSPQEAWPWRPTTERKGLLLVNGGKEAWNRAYQAGYRVIGATCSGPFILLTYPALGSNGPFDTRKDLAEVKDVLDRLNISEIRLTSLADGSLEILSFLMRCDRDLSYEPFDAEALCPQTNFLRGGVDCNEGFTRGECEACVDQYGSRYGYVDVFSWSRTWTRFLSSANIIGVAANALAA